MVLERLSWRVTCQNYVSVHLLTVAGRGSDLAVLQVGDAEKFPQAVDFESLDPFFRVSMQGPCFTAVGEDGGDKRLVEPDVLAKLMVLHHQILFSLAIGDECVVIMECFLHDVL